MNILHVSYDEKFIDFAADVFDSCAGATNRYVVAVDDEYAPLRYVSPRGNLRVVGGAYFRGGAMDADLAWCDALVVHYLGIHGATMIARAPSHLPVMWSGWGLDYYDLLPGGERAYLAESTRRMVSMLEQQAAARQSPVRRLRALLGRVRWHVASRPRLQRAVRRADYFSAPIPEDFEVARRIGAGRMRAEYAQLNYASVERSFAVPPMPVGGDAILVGNSASSTNNHVDVFEILARIAPGERRIVVPLSYGDAAYRDAVIDHGRALFGKRFEPIVDYMPLERYNAILGQCSLAVMGHRRQQAIGNVGTMLLAGARVFMDSASPVYRHLRSRGAVVHDLHELESGSRAILAGLTREERRVNRDVAYATWGHDVVVRNAQQFIDRLTVRAP